jgi:imidazole glycerol-phosphate synthase subunit HisH
MITIVDYGVGNLASIKNMLKKIGSDAIISSKQDDILAANKIILPGVGHFDNCMKMFNKSGLREAVLKKVLKEKIPVLGICVGYQMLFDDSEEGIEKGLGWIKGNVIKFNTSKLANGLKIPHMGWTDVVLNKPSMLFKDMPEDPRFYFVHSYHPEITDKADALLHATYGYPFIAAVEHENIIGVQFHPEKSHKFGMKLLGNFVNNY